MWLGDITIGDPNLPSPVDQPSAPPSPLVSLAANLVDMIHPYKQGVPLTVGISPQTQSFLMMGGVLIAGLVILNMVRK
jgi:hypothetical protein